MFYHVRHFTLLCLPKGCLLLSNRLSLKKSLEEATEELRRLWKGQLWRERAFWTTLSRHAVLVQSRAQSTAADPVGVAHPAAVVGLLEAGVPQKNMPKLTKSDQKVVKMEPQRGPGSTFGGRKPKMDARVAKRQILMLKSVPQGCQNGSQRGLKML